MPEKTTPEKTPLELAREELAAIRCEALHGDVRAAMARLIDRIADGVGATAGIDFDALPRLAG